MKLHRLSMLCNNYQYRKLPNCHEYYKCCDDYTSYYIELADGTLFCSRGIEPVDYHRHIVLSKISHRMPLFYNLLKEHLYDY